eukprot:868515-Rhodomonas_salina.2
MPHDERLLYAGSVALGTIRPCPVLTAAVRYQEVEEDWGSVLNKLLQIRDLLVRPATRLRACSETAPTYAYPDTDLRKPVTYERL